MSWYMNPQEQRNHECEPFTIPTKQPVKFRLASAQLTYVLDQLGDAQNGFNIRGSNPEWTIYAPFFGTGTPMGTDMARLQTTGGLIEVDASLAPDESAFEFFWVCLAQVLARAGAVPG